MRLVTVTLALLAAPVIAVAHHSRAEFTGEFEEIDGELVTIDWSNPHPTFTLEVPTGGGTEVWQILGERLRESCRLRAGSGHAAPGHDGASQRARGGGQSHRPRHG